MPRVHTRERKRAQIKKPMRCSAHPCKLAEGRDGDSEIRVGDRYYTWATRFGGPQFRHFDCGYPRPTQLSSRKTAQVEEAVQDADLSSWEPTTDDDFGIEDLRSLLGDVAGVARDVGQEYSDGADNMPDALQYGEQAEMMRDVGQRLDEWADELESFDPSGEPDLPDEPEREEFDSDEEFEKAVEERNEKVAEVLSEWADVVRGEVEDKLNEIPEYEG